MDFYMAVTKASILLQVFFFFLIILFIFGCAGSSSLLTGFL